MTLAQISHLIKPPPFLFGNSHNTNGHHCTTSLYDYTLCVTFEESSELLPLLTRVTCSTMPAHPSTQHSAHFWCASVPTSQGGPTISPRGCSHAKWGRISALTFQLEVLYGRAFLCSYRWSVMMIHSGLVSLKVLCLFRSNFAHLSNPAMFCFGKRVFLTAIHPNRECNKALYNEAIMRLHQICQHRQLQKILPTHSYNHLHSLLTDLNTNSGCNT